MTGIRIKGFFVALKFLFCSKYFFGCLDLSRFFFKYLKQCEEGCSTLQVCSLGSSA